MKKNKAKELLEKKTEQRREENLEFQQWFRDNWIAAGGLITKTVAAKILNVTQARITYLIKSGRFNVRKYDVMEFLDLPPIMTLQHHQNYQYLKSKLNKETERMPETQRESFRATMLQIYDRLDNQIEPYKRG